MIENKPRSKGKGGNPNWRKGGPSPNPGGRPTTSQALKEAFGSLTAEAIERARKLILSPDEKIAADMVAVVIKKGLPDGLSIEISGPDQGPIAVTNLRLEDLSDAELALLSNIAARGEPPKG